MSDRSLSRRRIYVGEGLTFEVLSRAGRCEGEAIDLTPAGVGLAVLDGEPPAVEDLVRVRVTGRCESDLVQHAVVRHTGYVRDLPRVGLQFMPAAKHPPGVRFPCSEALPAFATAPCPWSFAETLRFRVTAVGAQALTLRATEPSPPLVRGMELALSLQLPYVGGAAGHARVLGVRGHEVVLEWLESPQAALSHYLLAGDASLTPTTLRAAGLAVGAIEHAVVYDYATTRSDAREILALRLYAHQAEGHLADASIADLRSPFDAHARHLTCRFGGRIIGYVRVIFVDRQPPRSQYVSLGGHEVPRWLWDAGFVEAGAGAIHPDFQRTGLFVPLMQHAVRVAVQSGHRYVLGACDDDLLAMYGAMGFETLEERIVEPKPGWRFRSHLILLDAERLVGGRRATRTLTAMASAAEFGSPAVAA